jgi:hypothetical protein
MRLRHLQLSEEVSKAMAAPNVAITAVEPVIEGKLVYLEVAPALAGKAGGAQLSVTAGIQNNESQPVTLNRVTFDFVSAVGGIQVAPFVFLANEGFGNSTISAGAVKFIHIQNVVDGSIINIRLPLPPPLLVNIAFQFAGFSTPVTVSLPLAKHVSRNGSEEDSYLFPAKAADLAPGEFWTGQSAGIGSHHAEHRRFAYDMSVQRFDEEKGWTEHKPGVNGPNNEDFLCFGKPLYAMASGIVEEIVRDIPDSAGPDPNRIVVRYGDEVVRYVHLQQNTIDPDLHVGDHVTAGQFLGRVGSSGTGKPHLHIECRKFDEALAPAEQPLRPLPFHNAFCLDRDRLADRTVFSGPAVMLDGQGPPWGKDHPTESKDLKTAIWPAMLMPQRVERRGDSGEQAGPVDLIAAVMLGRTRCVTPVRGEESGRLKLIVWNAAGSTIERLGDSGAEAGDVDQIAAVPLGASRLVTAVRSANTERLKLILWEISSGGTEITRLGDSGTQAGVVGAIALADLGFGKLASAVRTSEGTLKVILWDASGATVTRLGDSGDQAGAVDLVAAVATGPGQLVTAVKGTESGRLRLIRWDISPDATTIARGADSGTQGGAIDRLAAAANGPGQLVTAVRTSGGDLRLIAWTVDGSGIHRVADSGMQAGAVDRVAVASLGLGRIATNVRSTNSGRMKLIVWSVDAKAAAVTRLGDSGEQVGEVDLLALATPGADSIITPVRGTASGRLRLITWRVADH